MNNRNPPAPDQQDAEMAEEGESIASFVTRHAPPKLDGASNYRRWAKNMEMVLLRMKAWELTTQPLPPEAERTEAWKRKNNLARSDIHLNCTPEQQDLIEDATTTYDSWKILRHEYNNPTEHKAFSLGGWVFWPSQQQLTRVFGLSVIA